MGQLVSRVQRPAKEARVEASAMEESTIAESAPSTFTLFRKLPPELRDRIWKLSLPGTHRETRSLLEVLSLV